MVKLDFENTFNRLHRSDMLLSVSERLPELYNTIQYYFIKKAVRTQL